MGVLASPISKPFRLSFRCGRVMFCCPLISISSMDRTAGRNGSSASGTVEYRFTAPNCGGNLNVPVFASRLYSLAERGDIGRLKLFRSLLSTVNLRRMYSARELVPFFLSKLNGNRFARRLVTFSRSTSELLSIRKSCSSGDNKLSTSRLSVA